MHSEAKKIILVVPSLSGGGAEKVATTLLDSFRKSAVDIKLVLVLFDEKPETITVQGIDVRSLGIYDGGNVIYTISKFFKAVFKMAKLIRRENPNAILSFMDYSNNICIIANRLAGMRSRMVISVHAQPSFQLDVYAQNIWERLVGVMAKRLYRYANKIIVPSESIYNDLEKKIGGVKNKITLIPNPVDVEKVKLLACEPVDEEIFKGDLPIIISIGRLSPEKGFEYLIKAFSLVYKKKDSRLVILGEGKEEPKLKELSISLGINDKVFLLGYKVNPYKYLSRSSVFVSSSLYEGFGVAIAEAMACNIPVVATRYNNVDAIVKHGKTGLTVPVKDEAAIADEILKLLTDRHLVDSLVAEAAGGIENLSSDKILHQYEAVLGLR